MPIDRSDRLWYRDAVLYQLHIKAFADANGDGIGDFAGLLSHLDYIRDLGVTAIWVLPFYPSPLKDDGYDIAAYDSVNPMYGNLDDFRRFLDAAHERNLRVITELVVNHTSDQHPWFQRARAAPPGSPERAYYVWSDDDQRYKGTRIIFLDTEKSNWTWDPVAKAYYWHRFYAHQPDLNFDNPEVLREIIAAMHFWLEMGVDGLRLDAVPYLCEREGTNNENLPETHHILKRIRAEVDAQYPDRMLLAEANQWPEDTQEYFGSGDECHMAFHFPLMPRMYMAIAQEDRHPITDILRQTPDIPAGCQWAIFLRNHDELTLEMVTDSERDYLWNFYAADRRARLNLGIRRRLAPLLENDRRKVELMTTLLLSMPGTPIVYYGDEIGMGDNIYLGDRDGVRTPMQWTPDRNGGFSRAEPQRLYLPAIMDPIYGFAAVNVEAQQGNPSSLLNWMRRMIAVRQNTKVFGRGDFVFLYPSNRKVLAFLRRHDDDQVLVVANLSRSAQAAEIDLGSLKGRIPIEMLGGARFPAIGERPFVVTLAGYGTYWFALREPAKATTASSTDGPELVTLVVRQDVREIAEGRNAPLLERDVLPSFLPHQRWFNEARAEPAKVTAAAVLPRSRTWLGQVEVGSGRDAKRYFVPLRTEFEPQAHPPPALAKVRRGARVGTLVDAATDEQFVLEALDAIRNNLTLPGLGGSVRFTRSTLLEAFAIPDAPKVQRLNAEHGSPIAILDVVAVLKVYRRLVAGVNPEVEISQHLTEVAGFHNTPAHLGSIDHVADDGKVTTLAALRGYVASQGDAWSIATDYLKRELEPLLLNPSAPVPDAHAVHAAFLVRVATLGRRVAEMHRALARGEDPAFRAIQLDAPYFAMLSRTLEQLVEDAFGALEHARARMDDATRADADRLLRARDLLIQRLLELMPRGTSVTGTRLHGDLHLAQVLAAKEDWYFVDFDAGPVQRLEARRAKEPPLKDVASMLRSFDYAARHVAAERATVLPTSAATAEFHALAWRDAARTVFLAAYNASVAGDGGGTPGWPKEEQLRVRLIDLYALEKALYEVVYEAANRPAWLRIPVRGILEILGLIKAALNAEPV